GLSTKNTRATSRFKNILHGKWPSRITDLPARDAKRRQFKTNLKFTKANL
ncbi:MAG: hypothetical protein ACI80I_002824, partial [Akkermansiaceae bacterium]